jgi:hypothetical protein
MAKSPYLAVHRALINAFPNVHFHVKTGERKNVSEDADAKFKVTAISIEYDMEEFLASEGNINILDVATEALDEFFKARGKKNHIKTIYLEQRESAQSAEDRQVREFVESFKKLVESEADNSTLENYARENVFMLPWRGPVGAFA